MVILFPSVARSLGHESDDRPRKPGQHRGQLENLNQEVHGHLDMTQTDEYVLQVLTTNGRATAVRIAQALGVSERTVRRSFKKLREYGFIERIGSDKAGYWSVTG